MQSGNVNVWSKKFPIFISSFFKNMPLLLMCETYSIEVKGPFKKALTMTTHGECFVECAFNISLSSIVPLVTKVLLEATPWRSACVGTISLMRSHHLATGWPPAQDGNGWHSSEINEKGPGQRSIFTPLHPLSPHSIPLRSFPTHMWLAYLFC